MNRDVTSSLDSSREGYPAANANQHVHTVRVGRSVLWAMCGESLVQPGFLSLPLEDEESIFDAYRRSKHNNGRLGFQSLALDMQPVYAILRCTYYKSPASVYREIYVVHIPCNILIVPKPRFLSKQTSQCPGGSSAGWERELAEQTASSCEALSRNYLQCLWHCCQSILFRRHRHNK